MKAKRSSLLTVVVTSNGQRIGTLTPAQFRAGADIPRSAFLATAVERFNALKALRGEPERVELALCESVTQF